MSQWVMGWVRWLGMARAPGGKAGADPPSVHRDTSRWCRSAMQSFAITMTLLVLAIRPPTDFTNLLHGLVVLWFDLTALTFNAVWQYADRHELLSEALDHAAATAISRRFQLALAWLAIGVVLGALVHVAGVAVIAAFNAFYWLPIRGESPRPRPS
jgi:hypothetical protein